MANGIRTGDPRGFNKGRSSKFREGSRVRQTPEEGQKTYRPKRCGNNNKDEDNSSKNFNDKNQQASSQKFRQLDEILTEVWKSKKFDDILIGLCDAVYNQSTIEDRKKGSILSFPNKGDLGLIKNYRDIIFTTIAAKIHNTLLLSCIQPEIKKFLGKNQDSFQRNYSLSDSN